MKPLLYAMFLAAVPALADTDLRPLLPPVRDQGGRNTCTAFEAVTLAEFLLRENGLPAETFSENYNYWAAKNFGLTSDYLRSTYAHIDGHPGYIAVAALNQGLLREADWPYFAQSDAALGKAGCTGDFAPTACFTGTPPAGKKPLPLNVKSVFIPRDKIRDYLETRKRPVLLNVHWYFKLADKKGNVRMPTEAESEACTKKGEGCGGHVVMLTGYRSDSKRFLFRSSWGSGWGDGGYGTMPEKFVLEQCEACQYLDDPTLSPDDRDLVGKSSQGVTAELLP